jgi:F0F1-type ATP synthase delta subunit
VAVISRRSLARYGTDQLLAGAPLDQVAKQLAAALLQSKRDKQVDLLISDIAGELEDRGKLASATVTSATPLTDHLKTELIKFIKSSTQVEHTALNEKVDKSVLGGVQIETARHSWDKTAKRALMDIREAF